MRARTARDRLRPSLRNIRGSPLPSSVPSSSTLPGPRPDATADLMPTGVGRPHHETDRITVSWQVDEAIRRLRPEQRQVLVEVYYRGRQASDVARALAIPERTVRSRLFDSLKALRLVFEEMCWASENVGGAGVSSTAPILPERELEPQRLRRSLVPWI